MSSHLEVVAALERARRRDHFVRELPGTRPMDPPTMLNPPLPAPIGIDCPDHPGWDLVLKQSYAWCRRGQHYYQTW